MYVNPNDVTAAADLNELNYAQKVVTTYINFLQTKVFYEQVIEDTNLGYSMKQLKEMTKIQPINSTEIFEISVTTFDPEEAYLLCMTMQSVAPELIKNIRSSAQISVVDPVAFPEEPSGPNIIVNTAIGGIIGFLLSVLLSFIWELIDVSVKDQEELQNRYKLPILGAIPSYNPNTQSKIKLINYIPFLKKKIDKKYVSRILKEDTKFVIKEAYNSLRTNLRFTLRKDNCKKLLISSPIPEEGKSTTSTNLAITIAQTGAKVLLLDCDLRKGRLHSFFKVNSTPGISDVLSGMFDEVEAIQDTQYENLQVITLGIIPPNPTELLASVQMEELIRRLEKKYDYIIIDSPPVNVVSDALSLVKMVDGVILVVREGITSHSNITSALTKYKFAEANVLGFVINVVSLNQGNKSKSQYYYYHYGHNDD
jgi:capsular exopolysaccharide synthesis family protein